MISAATVQSPIGTIILSAQRRALTCIDFPDSPTPDGVPFEAAQSNPFLDEAARQMTAYFQGTLRRFTLDIAPRGTEFQRLVWDVLPTIPYGTTVSYGEIARRIGKPKASRAVGQAVGRNPLPIVIPCHRVIGSDGSMTGFSIGLERKEFLLELESRRRDMNPPAERS